MEEEFGGTFGATLDLGKSVDDIEEPVLMPEGWYAFEVIDDPQVLPNSAMKEDPQGDKAGYNWVVHLKSVHDEAVYDGRRYTLWLGVPKVEDNDKYTPQGQKVYDAKMQRIVDFVAAFGGEIAGSKVSLRSGAIGQAYVLQRVNNVSGDLENAIDIFNNGFKPVE